MRLVRTLSVTIICLGIVCPMAVAGSACRYNARDFQSTLHCAEQQNPQAQKELGDKYLHGEGVAQSTAAAIRWYQQSAKAGYVPAQYTLGYLYQRGLGVRKSDHDAMIWYHQAAQAGNTDAQYNLGTLLLTTKEISKMPTQAFSLYQLAAKAGDADAANNLAYLHELGIGTQRDLQAAQEYYEMAARKNHEQGQYNMGRLLLGMQPVQLKEAQYWLEKSAKQGFAPAMALLGQSHYQAETPHYQNAYYWLSVASAFGSKNGKTGLLLVEKHLTPAQIQSIQNEVLRFKPINTSTTRRRPRY